MITTGRTLHGAMVALMLLVWASPARAQATEPPETHPTVVFLPRTAFHMTAEHLSSDDPRYVWEANFGGELDLVGYGTGRFTFEANYEVILGEEIRAFDPNQGNYILAGAASMRVRGVEFAGVLYHQSRHLADRPKQEAIDWNMFGGRVRHWIQYRQARIVARADVRKTFMHSLVDYSWEVDAGLRSDVQLGPGVGLTMAAGAQHLGVDGSRNRGDQTGYRVEGGVRLEGRAGAIELFVAGERRIDPYPLETGAATWFTAGFRLLSRQSGR